MIKSYTLALFDSRHYVLTCKYEELPKWIRKNCKKERVQEVLNELYASPTHDGQMIPLGNGSSLIWLKKKEHLVHELAHAVFYLFKDRGIPTSEENDEIFCYVLQKLYDELV